MLNRSAVSKSFGLFGAPPPGGEEALLLAAALEAAARGELLGDPVNSASGVTQFDTARAIIATKGQAVAARAARKRAAAGP